VGYHFVAVDFVVQQHVVDLVGDAVPVDDFDGHRLVVARVDP
jgi:hypothetical protein